ncbi:MAG TPA: succinate dehydrogenase assembly factor 2 [Caulobacteraceae bacterium]
MDDARLRKLKYRAWHRGFREADLILGPFVDKHAAGLNLAQLAELETLMEAPDPLLYGWITGAPAPRHLEGEVLDLIRRFRPPAATGA